MYGRFVLASLVAVVSAGLLILWINDPLPTYASAKAVPVPDGLVLPGSDSVLTFISSDSPDKVQTYFNDYFNHHWGWQQQFANMSCDVSTTKLEPPKFSFTYTRFGKEVNVHGFTAEEAAAKGFKNVPAGGTAFVIISH